MARSRVPRIIGKVLRLLLVLLILTVVSILCWRIFSSEKYTLAKGLQPNEALNEAYREHGDDLILRYQNQSPSITRGEKNYGYFSVVDSVFIPEAKQIQLVVRYNDSTLEAIQADKKLAEEPPKGQKILDVTLLKMVDLTPDDLTDNNDGSPTLGAVRIQPTGEPVIETTLLYTYCLYTFDNVTAEDAIAVFADIYYLGDVNYDAQAYGTLRVYHVENPKIPLSLSGDEIDALKEYGG